MRFLYPIPGAVALVVMLLLPTVILSSAPPALADSGGPDAYGYTWVDSKAPNPGLAFGWIDGVTGGRDLLLDDENCTTSKVSFGFAFRFYGVLYNSAYVCANGFIAFDFPAGYASETTDFASALDSDLDPNATGGGHVFVKTDTLSSPRRLIVTWNGVFNYATSDPQKFEIVLTENPTGQDGRILLQYASLVNPLIDHPPWIRNIDGTSHLNYSSALGNSLAVMFLGPGTAPPGDVLTARGSILAPATIEPGQNDVPMLRLNLTTPTNSVNLRRVRVDVTGATTLPGDVSRVALWRDADRDGKLNTSLDIPLVSTAPSGTPESALLTLPAPLPITAGTGESFFVVFDLPFTAVPGDWIGAGVLGASYITVDTPDNVSSANLPINSYVPGTRTRIVEGVDTLRVTSSLVTNPANVTQWQTDVPMFAATFAIDKGMVTVTQVNVTFLGTSRADVSLVKLFEDTNRDLILQPGADRLLGKGRFSGTGLVSFPLALQFVVGSQRTLWVSYDIAPDATANDFVGARVTGPPAITVSGTKDRVDPANFPVGTFNLSMIIPGLPPVIDSAWAVRTPIPDGFLTAGEYVLSSRNSRDLFAIGGNTVASWLIVENDADYLYVVYDAVGDSSSGPNDSASISFRTNRTAFPLAPADDEFGVGDPRGAFHAVWNDTGLAWRIEDPCSAGLDVNHTGLACTIGYGQSPLRPSPHRTYEFRIPLRLLEVPLPIPPGYTLGFAGESNWSEGVEERNLGGNASWPFADPGTPPRWYGVVRLVDIPPVNNAPVLNWTGEPGFVGDGLEPGNGTTADTYEYRISYQDSDGDFPALSEPRLHVLQGASEIAGSPFAMQETEPADANVIDGKLYEAFLSFSTCPQTLSYFFTAMDERGASATPTTVLVGPTVACPPNPPALSNSTVTPAQGIANVTNFTWSVEYRDVDNDTPVRIQVTIYKGGSPRFVLPLILQTWLGGVDNYTAGALYAVPRNLSSPGTDYAFSFLADDGILQTSTTPAAGPTVNPEPVDQLRVTFSDEAPLIEDAGRRNVTMLTAFLQANTNSVSMTSLRIDRAGGADADVAALRVYVDVDGNGVPSPGDTLLGEGPFSSGSVRFSGFSLQVTAGQTRRLIALVDIARNGAADDRVGLAVVDAGYLEVAPPDTVAPLSTFVSGRVLINRPAVATGLTAGGASDGTSAVLHLTDPQPALAWTFSDPNVNDRVQGAYNASVVSEPSGFLLWYANDTGTTSSRRYGGNALVDGASYRMDLRVFDGRLWGPPSSLRFRMNTPPEVPTLTAPANLAGDQGPDAVLLQWGAATDTEGDPLVYRWSLATRSDFVDAETSTTIAGSTSVTVPTSGGTTYYWRIEAYDQFEWSASSAPWSFVTSATSGEVLGRVVHAGEGLLAIVRVYNATGGLVRQVTTKADGTFNVSALPFDVYDVRVTSPSYQERVVMGVTLSSATPIRDLGDIELFSTSLEVSTMASWAILVVGIVVAIAAAGLLLRRRRREPSPDEEDLAEQAPAARVTAEQARSSTSDQMVFECPACGTQVDADAKTCPGCGAIFE